jgi:hypothetical protein
VKSDNGVEGGCVGIMIYDLFYSVLHVSPIASVCTLLYLQSCIYASTADGARAPMPDSMAVGRV